MLIANRSQYRRALEQYFSRMTEAQLSQRPPIEVYEARAQYIQPRRVNRIINVKAYILYTRDIEYNFPHTLDRIIIMPLRYLDVSDEEYRTIINHELLHIYFRYYTSRIVANFCMREGIVRIVRQLVPGEIINPDVTYHTALIYNHGPSKLYIYIALVDEIPSTDRPIKKYYTTDLRTTRISTQDEQCYYDNCLPYDQNDHPEEILATIISRNIL